MTSIWNEPTIYGLDDHDPAGRRQQHAEFHRETVRSMSSHDPRCISLDPLIGTISCDCGAEWNGEPGDCV